MSGGPAADLILGDCLAVMRGMEAGSVDAVATDPPAGIAFMNMSFDSDRGGRLRWVAWLAERLAECARVVRPGHYALVWALPRTSHWTACAIEDAGWTITERIAHLFGQGFPKSKARLKPACEDWWLCRAPGGGKVRPLDIDGCRVAIRDIGPNAYSTPGPGAVGSGGVYNEGWSRDYAGAAVPHPDSTRHDARGRYPANVCLSHHPDCRPCGTRRVKGSGKDSPTYQSRRGETNCYAGDAYTRDMGRSSVSHVGPDGTEEVSAWACVAQCPIAELDRQTVHLHDCGNLGGTRKTTTGYSGGWPERSSMQPSHGDSGGASRFFPTFAFEADDFAPFVYQAKATRKDRGEGNTHPTVKSIALMRWLVRLICPPGGTVLDPFAGSGSTGVACAREGFGFVGIESDPAYFPIARARLAAESARTPLLSRAD